MAIETVETLDDQPKIVPPEPTIEDRLRVQLIEALHHLAKTDISCRCQVEGVHNYDPTPALELLAEEPRPEDYRWPNQQVQDMTKHLLSDRDGAQRARMEMAQILSAALTVGWASHRGGPDVRALRAQAYALIDSTEVLGAVANQDAFALVPGLVKTRATLIGIVSVISQVALQFIDVTERERGTKHLTPEHRHVRDELRLLAENSITPELESGTLMEIPEETKRQLMAPPKQENEMSPVERMNKEVIEERTRAWRLSIPKAAGCPWVEADGSTCKRSTKWHLAPKGSAVKFLPEEFCHRHTEKLVALAEPQPALPVDISPPRQWHVSARKKRKR